MARIIAHVMGERNGSRIRPRCHKRAKKMRRKMPVKSCRRVIKSSSLLGGITEPYKGIPLSSLTCSQRPIRVVPRAMASQLNKGSWDYTLYRASPHHWGKANHTHLSFLSLAREIPTPLTKRERVRDHHAWDPRPSNHEKCRNCRCN